MRVSDPLLTSCELLGRLQKSLLALTSLPLKWSTWMWEEMLSKIVRIKELSEGCFEDEIK